MRQVWPLSLQIGYMEARTGKQCSGPERVAWACPYTLCAVPLCTRVDAVQETVFPFYAMRASPPARHTLKVTSSRFAAFSGRVEGGGSEIGSRTVAGTISCIVAGFGTDTVTDRAGLTLLSFFTKLLLKFEKS